MNPQIQEIVIDGKTYVPKDSIPTFGPVVVDGMKYVLIRTYSAGVHVGFLKSRTGQEVELVRSRRIWYWDGAASLSQLALDGVSKPKNCKFSVEVASIVLTQAIEVIEVSPKAKACIEGVMPWVS